MATSACATWRPRDWPWTTVARQREAADLWFTFRAGGFGGTPRA